MGKTLRNQQSIYLDSDKAAALERLAKARRLPKQILLREAVEDLLNKYEYVRTRSADGKRPVTLVRLKRP